MKKIKRSHMPTLLWASWGVFGENPGWELVVKINHELHKHRAEVWSQINAGKREFVVYEHTNGPYASSDVIGDFGKACKYLYRKYGRKHLFRKNLTPTGKEQIK